MNEENHENPDKPRRSLRSRLMSIGIGLVLVYVGLLVILFVFQAKLIFFPTRDVFVPPELHTWNYEDVFLTVGDESTHGWFVPVEGAPKGTILFSHGNAGNIADRAESISHFRQMGYSVFIYDCGGYGQSSGAPSEDRCYADIRAAWTHLTQERGIAADNIVLFGRSLGGGPTVQLATEVEPRAVILESTFSSIADMASSQFPIFPSRLLARHRFDTISKVPEIDVPILHVHSPDDELIPYTHGQRLFQASTLPKHFLDLKGDHNVGYVLTGEPYLGGLREFLETANDPPA